jgi:hypothetical protein
MIVNGGSNDPETGGTYGSITQGGISTINLSPMTSGRYAGIVFFQPLDNTNALTVSGIASGITGTIYAPGAALSVSGNSAIHASLVVDTLTISGNVTANGPSNAGPAGTGESGLLIGVVELNTTSTKSSTGKNGRNAARTVVLNGVSSPSPLTIVYNVGTRAKVNQSPSHAIEAILGLGLNDDESSISRSRG